MNLFETNKMSISSTKKVFLQQTNLFRFWNKLIFKFNSNVHVMCLLSSVVIEHTL